MGVRSISNVDAPVNAASFRPGLAAILPRLQNCFKLPDRAETLAVFEQQFRALPADVQTEVHALSLEIATKFCKETFPLKENMLLGPDDLFPFPFTRVALADYRAVNAVWGAMDRVLGRSEGPRLFIEKNDNRCIFGIARSERFLDAPVIRFNKIISEKHGITDKHSEAMGLKVMAFTAPDSGTIFVLPDDDDRAELTSTERSLLGWAYDLLNLDPADRLKVVAAVKEFEGTAVTAHEYGHLLSFRDQSLPKAAIEQTFVRDGKEHIHPSHVSFYDLGEVFAETFGVTDHIIEKRSPLHFVFALAMYRRLLNSPSKHARERALALIPLFLRNFTAPTENHQLDVNWEGLRNDLSDLKEHIYRLFSHYADLSAEEEDQWIKEGEKKYVWARDMQVFKAALGATIRDINPSRKSPADQVYRERATAMLKLEYGIPFHSVLSDTARVRKEVSQHFYLSPGVDEARDRENIIIGSISAAEDETQNYYFSDAINRELSRMRQLKTNPLPRHQIHPGRLMPVFRAVNDLLRIQQRIADSEINRTGLKEGWGRLTIDSLHADTFLDKEEAAKCFAGLISLGYIDADGVVRPGFPKTMKDFELPTGLELGYYVVKTKADVFESVKFSAALQNNISEGRVWLDEQLKEAGSAISDILSMAQHHGPPELEKLAADVLKEFTDELEQRQMNEGEK